MLNHSKNHLFGSNCGVLGRALLLSETLLVACPAQPSPPPPTAEVGQIAELVDGQGRRIYINSAVSDQPSAFSNTAARRSLSGSRLRTPDFGLTSLIRQVADLHRVDADLIQAIVDVESGYNSRAVSARGAMGLMQLIPATARRFGVEDPFDPRQNIEGGISYLKYLLALFDGDLALSLAAYNAGEKSVLREGGVPPFPETREYVQRVRSLYQPNSASNSTYGAAGLGNPILRVRRARATAGTSKASALAPKPMSAPFYAYIDAKGVVHMEQ